MNDTYTVKETKLSGGRKNMLYDRHIIEYNFHNDWKLTITLGHTSYSTKLPGIELYEEVELGISYKDDLIRFTHPGINDSVLSFMNVMHVRWIVEILSLDDTHENIYEELIHYVNKYADLKDKQRSK